MTKQDFELIAGAIALVEKRYGGTQQMVDEVVEAIAEAIEEDHPRFNRARFEMACLPIKHEEKKQAILAKLGMTSPAETCECGLPDNCGDCTHEVA